MKNLIVNGEVSLPEKDDYRTTTDRSTYNKLHKEHLEAIGEIRCTRCTYHGGENETNKWYGSTFTWRNNYQEPRTTRHPNWKLVSKNKKQWMKKNLKKTIKKSRRSDIDFYYIKISW